ncbi:DNA-formamidopyrimidine glycosylase [bacterium]|nr:DNA-formamidopyrimidine glycosylase [bacterium]
MPELPEVETTVRELRKKVRGRTFIDVWTDSRKQIKRPEEFDRFKEEIKGRTIEDIQRKGKNILFFLSGKKVLLVHQKLTGHLLVGKWKFHKDQWVPPPGPLSDNVNTYIHLMFILNDGVMMALSDLRKFAKVELWDAKEISDLPSLKNLGPDPLSKKFTFEKFKGCLQKVKKGKIKLILMNQTVISGIGNIYSDEILWKAKINPFKDISELSEKDLKKIYESMKTILKKAVEVGGESISDFRKTDGKKGLFDSFRKVYRRENKPCFRCKTLIIRKKIGGRSTYFCPKCQPL